MSKVDISDFTRKLDALSNAYRKVPNEAAALAVNFSKERFRERHGLIAQKKLGNHANKGAKVELKKVRHYLSIQDA